MPFTEDCQDRNTAPAPNTTEQLVKLTGIAEALGLDELAVLLLVAQRLQTGRARYGNLDMSHDPRCFRVETLEEAADGLVYAAAALMREQQRVAEWPPSVFACFDCHAKFPTQAEHERHRLHGCQRFSKGHQA